MIRIFKVKSFARWQRGERLPDSALCEAVRKMGMGLVDADLGGLLYKQRVARPGGGASGGYRTLLSARLGGRYVFLYGFAKNERSNLTVTEEKYLKRVGGTLLGLSPEKLATALDAKELLEVACEQDH